MVLANIETQLQKSIHDYMDLIRHYEDVAKAH